MRVCSLCGDTYRDHVDFCFGDGELLQPLSEEEISARIASEEPPADPLSRPLDAPGTYALPVQALPSAAATPEIHTTTAPLAGVVDPHTEALVKRVEAIVRASVAAVERREQRRRQAEAWRKLLSRFGIALGG